MYIIYLQEEDMKKDSKYPVIAHLNEAANDNLLEFLEKLRNGVGSGYDYSTGCFWGELDDFDRSHTDKFEGLLIETESGEKAVVSFEEICYYLNILLDRCQLSNSNKEKAREIVQQLKSNAVEKQNQGKTVYLGNYFA